MADAFIFNVANMEYSLLRANNGALKPSSKKRKRKKTVKMWIFLKNSKMSIVYL